MTTVQRRYSPAEPGFEAVGGMPEGPLALRPFDYDVRDGQTFGAGHLYRISAPYWFVSLVLGLPLITWLGLRLRHAGGIGAGGSMSRSSDDPRGELGHDRGHARPAPSGDGARPRRAPLSHSRATTRATRST